MHHASYTFVPFRSWAIRLAIVYAVTSSAFCQAADTPWASISHGSTVAVATATGRIVRGQVDRRTSSEYLWLSAEVEGMSIATRLTAADVVNIVPSKPISLPPPGASDAANDVEPPRVTGGDKVPVARSRVRTLAIFAQLENWDDDPEPDGLRLHLVPRGATGEVIRASGSVSAGLTVYRGDWRSTRGSYREEESWSAEVRATESGPHGAVIDLPFRNIHPEGDRDLQPLGDLRVRFDVAGEGSFDAALDDVELRPFSWTRDMRTLRSSR